MDSIIKVTRLEEEEEKQRKKPGTRLPGNLDRRSSKLASVDLVYLANPVPGFFFFRFLVLGFGTDHVYVTVQ